jgi:hypothetical protein
LIFAVACFDFLPGVDAILTLRGRAAWAHDFNTDRAAFATLQSLSAH